MGHTCNHPICDPCWIRREPVRIPVRLFTGARRTGRCCWCGEITTSGIYVRHAVHPDGELLEDHEEK